MGIPQCIDNAPQEGNYQHDYCDNHHHLHNIRRSILENFACQGPKNEISEHGRQNI